MPRKKPAVSYWAWINAYMKDNNCSKEKAQEVYSQTMSKRPANGKPAVSAITAGNTVSFTSPTDILNHTRSQREILAQERDKLTARLAEINETDHSWEKIEKAMMPEQQQS